MSPRPVIDAALVDHVVSLAKLSLGPEEREGLARDLAQILDYVQKLEELDLEDVPPTAHAVDLPSRWRTDEALPGLGQELALRGAPEPVAAGFGVPKVIE